LRSFQDVLTDGPNFLTRTGPSNAAACASLLETLQL
jgi:hypothetical protein